MRKPNAWLYSLGMLGIMNLMHAAMMYLTFYYVDTLGMAAALFALARTVKTVWDGVNDPLAGYASDRTRTRWGRRRPWLLAGLPFYALSFVALFWVPPAFRADSSLFWYVLAVMLVFETFDTIMYTNYNALFPELFTDVKERARAAGIRNGFHVVAMVLGFALPPVLVQFIGIGGMAAMFAAILAVTIILTLLGSPENPGASTAEPLSLAASFRETLGDRAFWTYSGAAVLGGLAEAVFFGGMAFYAKYALGIGDMGMAVVFGAAYLTILPATGVWMQLTQRWGARKAWLTSIALLAAAALPLSVARGLWGGLAAGVAIGGVLAGLMMTRELIMAQLIDRDARRTGRRREGAYYGIFKFVTKLSGTLFPLALVAVQLLFGYRSAADPGPNPEFAFRFMLSAIPAGALVLAFLVARRFPADEDAAAEPAADAAPAQPVMGMVTLEITGMHCDHCVARVTRELKKVPGVRTATVDLYTSQGTVEVAGTRPGDLVAAVRRAGYVARPQAGHELIHEGSV